METNKRIPEGIVRGCEKLNVRESPSTDSKVLTIVDNNSKLRVLSKCENENFYRVKVNGVVGYAMADYVMVLEGTSFKPNSNESETNDGRNKVRCRNR